MALGVPDDVLLASGHDSRAAQLSRPPLPAVDTRPEEQASAAVELLLLRLAGAAPTQRLIPGELHPRRSTQRASLKP